MQLWTLLGKSWELPAHLSVKEACTLSKGFGRCTDTIEVQPAGSHVEGTELPLAPYAALLDQGTDH